MGATNPNAGGAPGGGGKGGMGQGQARPMAAFGQMNNLHQGLGSAGAYGPSAGVSQMPAQQGPAGAPMANWQSMLRGFGGGGMPAFNLPMNFGGGQKPQWYPDSGKKMSGFGNLDMTYGKLGGGGTPMPNMTPPPPQPQEPVGGYINGQPAQFHYQAEALKKPAVNSVGLPTGGILARLYGG